MVFTSWKGDITKSGGIATNIGIHFFDMLTWIFGKVIINVTYQKKIELLVFRVGRARVRWF